MQIDIVDDKENKLLDRREIMFVVTQDGGTPSLKSARKELSSLLKVDPKLLVIERMRSEFGKRETLGYAKVYESEEHEKEIEHSHILLRNFPSSEEAKKVKKEKEEAAEASEEATEEKKEEPGDEVTEEG
ncbi:MAG: 30S ribosomal protein S24e [Halobacteriota archaeon]|nr:30S ribosomal protein S24e [Halobacteriota archaeon]